MDNILNWVITTLNSTALSSFIMNNPYFFPFLEMAHFLGLSLLFGSLLIVDLRMLGIAQNISLERVDTFIRLTLIGFSINLISGFLFVIGDSDRYLVNIAFWTKMALILVSGLNAAYFMFIIHRKMKANGEHATPPFGAKFTALLSLTLWTLVIVAGRFIPYVEDL